MEGGGGEGAFLEVGRPKSKEGGKGQQDPMRLLLEVGVGAHRDRASAGWGRQPCRGEWESSAGARCQEL